MKKWPKAWINLLCLLFFVVLLTGCRVFSKPGGKNEEPVKNLIVFEETFDRIIELTNIKEDPSGLDNPDSFTTAYMPDTLPAVYAGREPGTLGLDNGDENREGPNGLRIAFTVPGLKEATTPCLKLWIRNTSANQITLYIGNLYQASGNQGKDGHRSYAELVIPAESDYTEYQVALGTDFTGTELIQLRPTVPGVDKVTSDGATGLYLDRIQVLDLAASEDPDDYSPGEEPDPSTGPEPGDAPPDIAAKFGLYGFASVPTAEFPNGTTGGAGGEVSYVSNGVELQAAIDKAKPKNDGKPQIIYVQGEITPENSGDAKQIDIKDVSNVSVIGVGTSAVFNGIGINIVRAYNIIVQNVTVHHNRIGQKDAISIQSSGSHIWIDHCELYNSLDVHKDYYDELLSAKNETEYITFSWNYLHDSWKTSLIGSSDSDIYDRKITYHHNLIENCNSRLPSYRGGTGHIYNNYYKGSLSTCINSRVGAKLLIQNNYFEKCKNPIGTWFSKVIGYWYQEGNIFDNCQTTGSSDVDNGPAVPVTDATYNNTCEKIALPYSVTLELAEEAKASVLAGAGVGKISGLGGSDRSGSAGTVSNDPNAKN